MPQTFLKDPAAVLPYSWDWSDWLREDTIQTATVTAPAGLTVVNTVVAAKAVTAWLGGGVAGKNYSVVCHIFTAAGSQDERTISVKITDR